MRIARAATYTWITLGAMMVLLAACNRPTGTAVVDTGNGAESTAAALTVEAQLTELAAGTEPTATAIPVVPSPTLPPTIPLASPVPTGTAAPTGVPTATGTTTPCDRAGFVEDVTIPDGQDFPPGATFEKVWRLRNNGSCTWNSSYSVVFESGDAMGSTASVPLTTGSVAPGQEVDVKVSLTAPLNPGTYRGNWKLRNPSGTIFGVGPNADKVFWVEIDVIAPTATALPSFDLAFDSTHDCGGHVTAIFRITNSGSVPLESVEITIINLANSATLFGPQASDVPFMGTSGECPPGGERVPTGRTWYVGASLGSAPPSGAQARSSLKICTQNGLAGGCLEKSVDFTIP